MKIAVIFHRLGPYHWARLQAAARRFDLVVIEQSAETAEYAWDKVAGDGGFERVTLFDAAAPAPAAGTPLARRTGDALARADPRAVAIPGWSNAGGLAALAWCLRRGVPAVVMSESTAGDRPRAAWKEWPKRRVVGLCSAGLVGGAPHKEYLQALGMPPGRIAVGYDVVDNAHFAAGADAARRDEGARARLGLPPAYFLASNRFLPQKNLFSLLDAFAAYRRSAGPAAWSLVLLGDGPLKGEILRRRASLGLEDALVLPGFKQYGELPAFYGLAGAFVHAAASEPWGLVVNEAVAAGLPVIVSDVCGCARDLVADGQNGFTFPPHDPAALTERMSRLTRADAPALAAMARASREIAARWSVDRFADGLAQAVETALAVPRPAATMLDRGLLRLLASGRVG